MISILNIFKLHHNFCADSNNGIGSYVLIIVMVAILAVAIIGSRYFNKKKQKQQLEKISEYKEGKYVCTIGGIIGKIISINKISDSFTEVVIETGNGKNKNTLTMTINAIANIIDEQYLHPTTPPSDKLLVNNLEKKEDEKEKEIKNETNEANKANETNGAVNSTQKTSTKKTQSNLKGKNVETTTLQREANLTSSVTKDKDIEKTTSDKIKTNTKK